MVEIACQPQRALDDLRALAELTGGPDGARRVCWTDEWASARGLLRERLAQLPVEVDVDEAGNLWARLAGARPETVVIGSHIDSVPNGGWLDGALGVMGALETLRTLAEAGTPPCTVTLVDWADEEGARFGRSLFGSSAVAGTLAPDAVRDLRDAAGTRLEDALAAHGVDLDRASEAGVRLRDVRAYLELHIEQGPVLESLGAAAGTVLGTVGVERHRVIFRGQAAHAGSTPMTHRRDSFLAAARFALAVRDAAIRHEAVSTTGAADSKPGVVTAIAGETALLLDQRHLDADALAALLAESKTLSAEAAEAERCTVEWEPLWAIEPIPFDPELIAAARAACRAVTGSDHALPSGPLHDAAEMARRVPTVMIFSSSTNGISHAKEEDTPTEHLELAICAFARTVGGAIDRVAGA
ncbi:MAG: beta-ureidopropionase / N-carbamoyl-L-amino-acid hydrolase [Gaiellales bacterium]|nr:beta-ureidopropionase / N-carbamoyl-L-amino-acid hydrolase [Gaiellales bacterium]